MAELHPCDLSVIMPAYNAEDFVVQAIQSVLDQAPPSRSIEVVVVDDGSTDRTAEAIRSLGEIGRVRYFHQENQGPSAARNLALSHSRGQLIMLLDADDELYDGCLETTLDFMERHPVVGLLFTNYDVYDENAVISTSGVDTWKRFRKLTHREERAGEWIFTESLTPHIVEAGGFMHTSGLTIRRETYEEIGPFREGYSYAEDDEFYARAAHVTTAGYVDRVLSRKRNHAGSLIHNPANVLTNTRDLLDLSEIQLTYYCDDPLITRILNRKIPRLALGWCWLLVEAGRGSEARKTLRTYLARYPRELRLYRLWIRSWWPA